jgi:hypothetical protein
MTIIVPFLLVLACVLSNLPWQGPCMTRREALRELERIRRERDEVRS